MAVATLDAGAFSSRTIGLRVDINSPVDADGSLLDDSRFCAHLETIEELLEHDAAVVILAHQGRPGREDFTSLSAHASHLGELLDREVSFVDSVFSSSARDAISDLDSGELLCLENLRFASEELLTVEPAEGAKTHLVSRLSEVLDVYVNDAFAVAHRSQPSVVGFPERLPSFAGRLMEREQAVLGDLTSTPSPRVALLAGAKIDDSLAVLERLLQDDLVDRVLAGGLVANAFFVAGGEDPGEATERDLVERGYGETIERAAAARDRFGDRIVVPTDVVVPADAGRSTVDVASFPLDGTVPRDIGPETIATWRSYLSEAATVICNGPVGQFEDERFADGTAALFEAAAQAEYAIAGGGDTSAALARFDIEGFEHVSTGGGAALTLLSGRELPGLQALESCTIELPH